MSDTPQEQASSVRPIDKVRKASKEARRAIEVPEWDLTLYFGRLTMNDQIAVEERMRDTDGVDPEKHKYEKRVLLLIHKAELEDGSQAFQFGDKHYLMSEADYGVLSRLIGFMYQNAISAGTLEDAKKKSEKTEGSDSA